MILPFEIVEINSQVTSNLKPTAVTYRTRHHARCSQQLHCQIVKRSGHILLNKIIGYRTKAAKKYRGVNGCNPSVIMILVHNLILSVWGRPL